MSTDRRSLALQFADCARAVAASWRVVAVAATAVAAITAPVADPAGAGVTVIRGATVLTVTKGTIEGGTVVVRDGGAGLSEFRQDGELGFGLRIIEELTSRLVISSTPNAGTEVRMVFAFGAEQD